MRKKITKLQSNSLESGLETEPESVDMPETPPANDEPDLTKTHTGYIISYDYFEGKGKIQGPNEEQYLFDVKDITDKSLQKNIKKIDKRTMTPIPVKFQLLKSGKNYLAVSIKRGTASFYLPSAQWNAAVEAAAETPQHQQICPCQLLFSRQQRQRRKHLHLLLKSPWKKVRTESS